MSQEIQNLVSVTPAPETHSVPSPESSVLPSPENSTPPTPVAVSESFREFPIQISSPPPNSLTDQQLRVIDLLITGTTLTEAAAAVGVTVRTIYNWRHRDAAFAAEYDTRCQLVWDQSLREMRDLIAPAVRVFAEQLKHRHDYPRYRAANAILRIAGVKKALSAAQDSDKQARTPQQPTPAISGPPKNPAQHEPDDESPRPTTPTTMRLSQENPNQ